MNATNSSGTIKRRGEVETDTDEFKSVLPTYTVHAPWGLGKPNPTALDFRIEARGPE